MRRCLAIALLAVGTGCGPDQATDPAAMTISVRLRDDAGAAAGPNQVVLTDSAMTKLTGRTRSDGTAEFVLPRPGDYTVQVIPRAGYLWSADLRKAVAIASPGNLMVEFTLHRDGIGPIDYYGRANPGGSGAPTP